MAQLDQQIISAIGSAFIYASLVWRIAASTHTSEKPKLYKIKFYTSLLLLHRDQQIETISTYIKHTAQKLFEAARYHENQYLR